MHVRPEGEPVGESRESPVSTQGLASASPGLAPHGPPSIRSDELAPFPHGFFGRQGGVSGGIYGSLNCGLGSNDDRLLVSTNRAAVAASLGTDAAHLLTCHQVHSAIAVIVDQAWPDGGQPRADALVTRTPGLALGALAADCMPILFADAQAGVIAAAHAGWKGALAGIEVATLAAMEKLGAQRRRVHAIIGPCISQDAYEVGPEFQLNYLAADPGYGRFFLTPPGKSRAHFDLPAFMLHRLRAAGVGQASWVGACTYANPDRYFSFRRTTQLREPDYGRQIAAILIPG